MLPIRLCRGLHGLPVEEPNVRTLIHRWAIPVLLVLPAAAAWPASEEQASRASQLPKAPAPSAPASNPSIERQGPAAPERLATTPPSAAPAAQPAASAETPEERIKALEEKVQQLMDRIDELEKKQAPAAPPPQAPAPAVPAPETPAPETPAPEAPPTPTATLLPNISAIGNFKFVGSDSKGTENRGKVFLDEFEIGLQDRVAPDLRMDAFLSSETPDFNTKV